MYIVGLTGGIASGKTAVSDRFAALGVPIIDTDVIARQIVEPGQAVLQQITTAFGDDILDDDGHLQRRKLRELIFSEPDKQELLENIMHPAIRAEARRKATEADEEVQNEYCMVVIPLLAESGHFDWLNRILLVDVTESTQITRLMARDGVTESQARASLAAQASRADRLSIAHDVIENEGAIEDLDEAVAELHSKYLKLGRSHRQNSISPES